MVTGVSDEADKPPTKRPSDRADAAAVAVLHIINNWQKAGLAPADLHARLAAYLDGVVGQ
jgi:hypothetical protein